MLSFEKNLTALWREDIYLLMLLLKASPFAGVTVRFHRDFSLIINLGFGKQSSSRRCLVREKICIYEDDTTAY